MSAIAGLVAGLLSGFLTLLVSSSLAQGLPSPEQQIVAWALTIFAFAVGFLVGGTVVGRATRDRDRLVLFSGLTAALGGGVVGVGLSLAVLGAYLDAYAVWPSQLVDQVLFVLAFPAFGMVGFFVGAAGWSVCGLVAGAVLSRAVPRPH